MRMIDRLRKSYGPIRGFKTSMQPATPPWFHTPVDSPIQTEMAAIT